MKCYTPPAEVQLVHSTAPDDRMEFYLVVDNATFVFIQFINCKKKIIDSASNVSQFIYRRQLQHFFFMFTRKFSSGVATKTIYHFPFHEIDRFCFCFIFISFFFTNDLSLNFHQKKKKSLYLYTGHVICTTCV